MSIQAAIQQMQNLVNQQNAASQASARNKEGLIRQSFETQRELVGQQTQDAATKALSRRGIDINTPHGQRMLQEMRGTRYDSLAAQEAQQLANLPDGNDIRAQLQAIGMMADMARQQQGMEFDRERFAWQQQQAAADRAFQQQQFAAELAARNARGGGGGRSSGGGGGGRSAGGGRGPGPVPGMGGYGGGDPQIRSPLESIFADEVRHADARREWYLNNLPDYGSFSPGNPRAHNVLSADNPYNTTLYSGQPANSMVTGGRQPSYLGSPVAMGPSTVGAMDGFSTMRPTTSLYQPGPSSVMMGASSTGFV